jgi:serine protease
MKRILYPFIAALLITTSSSVFSQENYVPNEIMVMLKPGNTIEDLMTDLNNDGYVGEYRMKQVLSNRYRIYLLEHDAVLGDTRRLVKDIYGMDQVAIAQLNHYVQERITPDDPSYATQQWNMNNTGGGGGTADADIDAPEAWNTTTGGVTADGDTIVVAVVDGRVQRTHPDLVNNMWRNYAELNGTASVDDDGNGYVDDFYGWNAVGNNNSMSTSYNSHATHCAGIVGAKGNNTTGVTGVNWNVKILSVNGSSGTESVVVLAYDYVCSLRSLYNTSGGTSGAFVVATSNSFGVDFGMPASYPLWCAMYDTLGSLGILSAGAGPNNNVDVDVQGDIPSTCPSNYLIGVTNTTNTDARNGSCGYGPVNIDIGAPGTNIYSTYTTSTYNGLTGTSMATPHVAGAIGLYYSAACQEFIQDYKADPTLALQMKTWLLTGVDSIASMATTTYSHGRLNLNKGILKVQTYNCLNLPPVAGFSSNDQNICTGATINYTDASTNGPTSWNWSFPGGTPSSSTSQNPSVTYNSVGTYNAQLIATNSDGSDTILYSNYITVNTPPAAPTIVDNAGTLQSSIIGTGNQWYLDGVLIAGATNDTYIPTQGGLYTCTYTDANGCTSTASNTLVSSVSLEDIVINFSVYPNPASEKLIIDAGTTVKATISLMDLSGRIVMSIKMNQSLQQMDVSNLSDGVYMLKIEYAGRSITKKIVKR